MRKSLGGLKPPRPLQCALTEFLTAPPVEAELGRFRHVAWILGSRSLALSSNESSSRAIAPSSIAWDFLTGVSVFELVATFTGVLVGFGHHSRGDPRFFGSNPRCCCRAAPWESFGLLVVNMLQPTVALLFLATVASIAGAVFDDGASGSNVFETIYTVLLIAGTLEFALSGFYFGLVHDKVATNDSATIFCHPGFTLPRNSANVCCSVGTSAGLLPSPACLEPSRLAE